ncbi:MAG TPA: hypothetical protein ENN07_05305 [candidate division Zixibacteria bacterium]|nr:hypothetical protein [candidate division Zixibacteria bacterium]
MLWKKQIPLAITFIMGLVFGIQYFVPHRVSDTLFKNYLNFAIVIGVFGTILAYISFYRAHTMRIRRKAPAWPYSVIAIIVSIVMAIFGFAQGMEAGTVFSNMYFYVLVSIEATMFSLLAFYISSAAYRAFRARSAQATALLVAAIIVMIGRIPLGEGMSFWTLIFPEAPTFPDIANWILNVPNMAAKRAMQLGIGLGMMMLSLKIVLGIERSYMGGGD